MRQSQVILELTHQLIYSYIFKEKARVKPEYFSRSRKLPFEELMIFVLESPKSSTSSALRRFFDDIGKNTTTMSQQALSEARKKVNVWAFTELYKLTVNTMTEYGKSKWNGYRIYAIDGSKIALPAEKELKEHYGALGKDGSSPTAQGSVLYDVLNDIVSDALIEPLKTDERTLALRHIEALKEIGVTDKKLIIFDRGYASFDLIARLENEGLNYLMRVKTKFNLEIDAQTSKDGYVWLEQNGKRICVRVIKFLLDSGETETLITNITDKRLGTKAFKKLYFKRWPVEIKYDIVKNKLQLENFNTRTVDGIQQDFYAAMYLTNFAASLASDAQADIDAARKDKNNKYQYKANINEVVGILKDHLVFALAQDKPRVQSKMINAIIEKITRYVTPVRPNRSKPRNPSPRATKFHHNQKANC
jgi:hypothetical protein